MAKTRYNKIYMALREKMEDGTYGFQELLPSENALVEEFDCPRNIIHRTIGQLVSEGYVQSIHGKEVRIIYQPGQQQSEFVLGGIESLRGAIIRNRKNYTTKVVCFAELTVDGAVQKGTTFPAGAQIYYTQRVRCIEGEALIIDHNYFLGDVVQDLAPEIAERPVYEYIEKDLGESVVTTRRKMTVGHVNQIDETYPGLEDYNCMTAVSSMICNKEKIMFEFTQSKHRPDRFVFYDLAHQTKQID